MVKPARTRCAALVAQDMRVPAAIFISTPAHRRGRSRFQPRPAFSALPDLPLPGITRLFIRSTVTDQHHPVIAQHQRIERTTAQDYGLPIPPERIRQLLDQHPAPPQGSADAI